MNKLALRFIFPLFILPAVGSAQDKAMRDMLGTRLTAAPGPSCSIGTPSIHGAPISPAVQT